MDDVQNASAPLYGKAEPTTAKTTMSVREMQHLLGLGKTDSYWLLHKNFFEVILINDKMRIVISSFEKWYANQVKYHKVNGPPPGEELCKRSYSVLEVAEILKVDSDTVYTLIRQGKLKAETVDFWMRIHLHKQRTSACGCCFTERLGKQKCHHSFSIAKFSLHYRSGSEKPQNRQQYPNHLPAQNSR